MFGQNKEHAARQNASRIQLERFRREAQTAIEQVNGPLVDSLNLGVAQVFKNEKDLEGDAKRLQAALGVYQKQVRDWITMIDQFDDALKELGDVKNWSTIMERDMLQMLSAVERARNPQPDPPENQIADDGPGTEADRAAMEAWLDEE